MSDEKLFQRVENELNGKPRKYTDKALWTKAEVLSEGDEKKTRYKYIELRVEKLKEQDAERLRKAEKTAEQQREISRLEEEQRKKESTDSALFWPIIILAFIVGRFFGFLGVGSFFLGYLAYEHVAKNHPMLVSIFAGVAAAVISYFIALVVFVNGLELL